MSTGTLSLLGLYNYDNSLFDGMIPNLPSPDKLPNDYPELYITGVSITPTTVINNLLMECAELEILYTNPDFLKFAISQWSDKQRGVWQSYYNTTCYRYNPIWNKDGVITRTESETRETDNTTTRDLSHNYTRDLTKTSERDLANGNQRQTEHSGTQNDTGTLTETPQTQTSVTQEEQVSAFNSADYRNKNQITTNTNNTGSVQNTQDLTRENNYNETVTDTGTDSGTITDKDTGTETNSDTGTVNDKGSETINRTYEDKETGNIGITMTQQMISAERDIASFNIIDYIIDDFKKRFCLLIY